jgi:hypothetical protein
MRAIAAGAALLLCLSACSTDDDLAWVTPREADMAPIGDPVELAVASSSASVVTFSIDGAVVGVCDPAQPEEDCRRDDVWRWTAMFDHAGTFTLTATSDDGLAITRTITIVQELPPSAMEDTELGTEPEPDDIGELAAANRGVLDPDRPFHNVFGGIRWKVLNQRVRLTTGIPAGDPAAVKACMQRYGASIRKWADHFSMSRASVVATALTESNCTNPAGSSDGLSSGPMQVTASTCSAITGLSRATCRSRMHTSPDFSFQVGVKYMSSSFQRSQHHRDPPKIAAAYNAGSLRRTSSNRWHLVSTGNHIDRFVRHYNAYRVWESQQ